MGRVWSFQRRWWQTRRLRTDFVVLSTLAALDDVWERELRSMTGLPLWKITGALHRLDQAGMVTFRFDSRPLPAVPGIRLYNITAAGLLELPRLARWLRSSHIDIDVVFTYSAKGPDTR